MKKINEDSKNNLSADEEDKEKKKKKRSQKKSELNNIINDETEPLMSEGSMGGRVFQNYCPILDAIEKRCRGVDIYSGDSHHNLLEACGAHQLCYLCVCNHFHLGQNFFSLNNTNIFFSRIG